jgi:heat shock protein HslJ
MKKIYLLLLLPFFVNTVKAQDDPELLGTWFLHYIETSGTTLYAQTTPFPLSLTVTSSANFGAVSGDSTCNSFFYDYQISNGNTSIDVSNLIPTLALCPPGNPDLETFELTYLGILGNEGTNFFDYTVDTTNNILTMTDLLGEKLVYGRQVLSTKSDELFSSTVKLYPNPVQKELFVTGITTNAKASYTVYSLVGNVVISERTLKQGSLDVSQLKAGIYFIEIQQQGQTAMKKFVKY